MLHLDNKNIYKKNSITFGISQWILFFKVLANTTFEYFAFPLELTFLLFPTKASITTCNTKCDFGTSTNKFLYNSIVYCQRWFHDYTMRIFIVVRRRRTMDTRTNDGQKVIANMMDISLSLFSTNQLYQFIDKHIKLGITKE